MKENLLIDLDAVTETLHGIRGQLMKPLMGGVWGNAGRFVLATLVSTTSGLHEVIYLVKEAASGAVLSGADSKDAALRQARSLLEGVGPAQLEAYFGSVQARRDSEQAEWDRKTKEAEAELAEIRRSREKVGSIPRRRRQIFEESEGKCHYCGTVLKLDGAWHIEHKMPRALGGSSEPSNLVAACIPCNREKRDTTDVEFKAKRAREAA